MPDDFQQFYETPYAPIKDMSRSEVEDELTKWRNLWTWVEPDVQWWLTHVGAAARLVMRNYHVFSGTLGQPHFKIDQVEINVVEREYDPFQGKATYQTKTVRLGLGAIVSFELVLGEEFAYEDIMGNVVVPDEDKVVDLV